MLENHPVTTIDFKRDHFVIKSLRRQQGAKGMETITKKMLVQMIATSKGVHPDDVREIMQSFLDVMTDHLKKGNRLEFRDFGVFEIVQRKQKIGRNPKNAAVPIIIPARSVVKFTPGKKMRQLVSGEAVDGDEGEE